VLVIQDSSSLNFTRLRCVDELGPIDSAGLARGLLFHSALALDPDGMVLGLLDLQAWARRAKGEDKPEEKESLKWLYGVERSRRAVAEAAGQGPLPRLVHIMDREGDCFDVMLAIDDAGDDAIIRCAQNRRVEGPVGTAHEEVRSQPLLGVTFIDVPRRPGQAAR